jgi:hypothetical protein
MLKDTGLEIVPPGLVTVIDAVPVLTRRGPETLAVTKLEFETVVGNAVPFQSTTLPDWKPDPETDSVKPELPATAVSGKRNAMLAPRIVVTSLA